MLTVDTSPKTAKKPTNIYLKICLNKLVIFEKLPFEKTEPNKDKNKIESESGSNTNLIIYEPVCNKKAENELKTIADFEAPESVKRLINIGNKSPANENKSSTRLDISPKKLLINKRIVVEIKKENIILKEAFKSTYFEFEKDLKISNRKTKI